ncbi:class I SAM-dependent methyltransferase [Leptospira semungkisensis]|uniref:Class I SAM-dependent methyltransferase n=1 Tax=Leptospira semungkisensis TaxID=2484985 RepID=A0A4R9FMS5_9LEPT|nr:class I SAM-dependent methyltransferase [Leptospira semungkisensis]TGJ99544.1 class I SAM-dependent methyltransferase [Leptospira semungkisensis]
MIKQILDSKSENPNRALWEKGDFTEIAALMRQSGEVLVADLKIPSYFQVLDLGSGDGTTAIPIARTGAEVTGIDIAKNLVEAGNQRATEEGLTNLKFQEGDACNLQEVRDHSFDLTLSVFGAMFAPKPYDVASEMVRVTKPGGRIVMGNWIPNDPTSFVSQLFRISASFSPPPPEGFISPMTWGMKANVIDYFAKAGVKEGKISMLKDTYSFISQNKSPEDLIELLRKFYGPTMNAFEAAEKNDRVDELRTRFVELANQQNLNYNKGIYIPATFLRVIVHL